MKSEDMEVLEGLGVENILFVKGRISNPVQANPLKWFSKHCFCTSPFAAWRIGMFFWYKTSLVSFQLCECTLCGRLPVLACSAMRAHTCHLLGRDMKPWSVPACEQATIEEAAVPNKTLITSLISFKSSQGTSLFSSPCSKKNQYQTVGEQKPVTAPAGWEHKVTW